MFPDAREVKSKVNYRRDSYVNGFEDGRKMGIGRPVGHDKQEEVAA